MNEPGRQEKRARSPIIYNRFAISSKLLSKLLLHWILSIKSSRWVHSLSIVIIHLLAPWDSLCILTNNNNLELKQQHKWWMNEWTSKVAKSVNLRTNKVSVREGLLTSLPTSLPANAPVASGADDQWAWMAGKQRPSFGVSWTAQWTRLFGQAFCLLKNIFILRERMRTIEREATWNGGFSQLSIGFSLSKVCWMSGRRSYCVWTQANKHRHLIENNHQTEALTTRPWLYTNTHEMRWKQLNENDDLNNNPMEKRTKPF